MQARDYQDLIHRLKDIPLSTPPVLLVTGVDGTVFAHLEDFLRNSLLKHETLDVTVLTGEPEDARHLLEEIFNIPLFSPYRLYLVKNGGPLFKEISGSGTSRDPYQLDFTKLPDRTMLAVFHEGDPPKSVLKLFGDRLLHLATKSLYAENMEEAVRRAASHARLSLTEEAVLEIRERVAPREGAVQEAIKRIKDLHSKEHPVTLEEVRDILFPKAGWDMFRLADACFAGDLPTFTREIANYAPPDDSFLALLKTLLNRADELRRYQICRAQSLSAEETLLFTGLKNRHPFIQKKALKRLQDESNRYGTHRMGRLYKMLVETSIAFRLNVPADRQSGFFQKHALEVFF